MSDAPKIPFEPIPVPPVGSLPAMPPLTDPAKPSFSRSTTPPAPAPRKPFVEDDMIPLSKFLPSGIAPETPEPAKAEAAPAKPGSWLRRKRVQLVMGAASIGGAAYGLHEFAPNLKPQANVEQPVEVAKAVVAPVSPKIAVERGPELPKPSVAFERNEELKPLGTIPSGEEPAPLRLTAGVTPLPVPALPTEIQATPPAITLPPVEPAPAVMLPRMDPPTAPVVPTVVPLDPKPAPALPPVQLDPPAVKPITLPPVEPSALPVLPPVETEKPKPLKLPEVPVETPKPVVPVPTPLPTPTPTLAPVPAVEPVPTPTPAQLPTPAPSPAASNVVAVPLVQPEATKPVVVGEPKTDYDVDVHRVRNAETYQSLSEKYYGSTQYAGALKAYNRGAELGQLKEVHVPPMFVIRKMTPAPAGSAPPPEIVTAGAEPAWTGVGAPKNGGDVRFETYRVPRPGMTMRDVAKAVYGRESEWPRVDNRRNIKYRPDEELPVGAELQVPVERPDWR